MSATESIEDGVGPIRERDAFWVGLPQFKGSH
jgi:hypothetical protein